MNRFDVDDEVLQVLVKIYPFLRKRNLVSEFESIVRRIHKVFGRSTCSNIELIENTIVFQIDAGMDRTAFKKAREAFYTPLRWSGSKLYPIISIIQDC